MEFGSRNVEVGIPTSAFIYLNWSFLGSGFKVQRLLPVDAAHHIDQDSEYPTYPLGCNGFIYMTKTEFLWYVLSYLGVFQPWTLNPEPLNLYYEIMTIIHLINHSTSLQVRLQFGG